MKAAKTKKMGDLVMLAQTKDMIKKSRVLLLSIKDYRGEYHLVDDITFSAAMLNLTEQPGVGSIVNQVTQLTRIYN